MAATYDDAALLVQLMQWGTQMGLDDALSEIFSEDFIAASTPMDSPSVRKVLSFGETVGALVKHGVLDKDLLRDVFWFDGMWRQVSTHALKAREQEGEPMLYENFEALVTTSGAASG